MGAGEPVMLHARQLREYDQLLSRCPFCGGLAQFELDRYLRLRVTCRGMGADDQACQIRPKSKRPFKAIPSRHEGLNHQPLVHAETVKALIAGWNRRTNG